MEKEFRQTSTEALRCPLKTTLRHGEQSDKSGCRILLAGRSVAVGSSVSALLSSTHHRLIQAHSVEEAVALVSTGSVDLVITDHDLPDLGPIHLCGVLKRSPATQFLPVFVLGAESDLDVQARAIESGADAFLPMPIQPRIFHAHVNSALRRKALVDKLDDSESVLFSLAASVEERNGDLGKHCERLTRIASAIGLALQLPSGDIVALQRGGYLHDIGKVAIPDHVLLKAGPLSPDEWRIMESHTIKGEQICKGMKSLKSVLPIIRHHHEKWDGTGYPDRLRAEQIPLLARIVQLADIYDALTAERSYKPALTPAQAIEVIQAETKKGWRDPFLTATFADLLPSLVALDGIADSDVTPFSLHALANKLNHEHRLSSESKASQPEPLRMPAR